VVENIIAVDVDNFSKEVLEASDNTLVLLDISAEWCGPCKVIEPMLDQIATNYTDSIILAKLEAEDENMKIAGKYGVKGFPTVISIYQRKEIDRFHGAKTLKFVTQFVDDSLSKI